MNTPRPATRSFRAMGTQISLTGSGLSGLELDHALNDAIALAEQWESRFSRFRPESELSRLNGSSGSAIRVSQDMLALVKIAIEAVRETNGRFNPAVLPRLELLGYDRTFGEIKDTSLIPAEPLPLHDPMSWIDGVEIDAVASTVLLPDQVRLDLGGIAKGAFVDRLASDFAHWPGGCVDAGGDLAVWGSPPTGASWRIGVEHPCVPDEDVVSMVVTGGPMTGIATSAPNRRVWTHGGQTVNHLIDPVTSRSIATTSPQITVIARDVVTAEILTKSLLVAFDRSSTAPLSLPSGTLAIVAFQDGTHETHTPQTAFFATSFFHTAARQSA